MATDGESAGGGGRTPDGGSGGEALAGRIDELCALLAAQASTIEALQQRLARLEAPNGAGGRPEPAPAADLRPAAPPASTTPGTTPITTAIATTGTDGATGPSRRHLMTKGAAVAAGAAIAGTVLSTATAPPAAASSGLFDGAPAVLGTAVPGTAVAVHGTTSTGTGVLGTATGRSGFCTGVSGIVDSDTGYGVLGQASSFTGLCFGTYGLSNSTSGAGLWGEALNASGQTRGAVGLVQSPNGIGVWGQNMSLTGPAKGMFGEAFSPNGFGVYGFNHDANGTGMIGQGGTGVEALSATTQLRLTGAPVPPADAGLARRPGELVFDSNRDLWICVAGGTPGTWRRVGGPATAGSLTVLPSTVRIYDSRPGTNPQTVQKGIFTNHEQRTISATVGSAVPAGANAVLINATATNTNPGGFFSFFKNGIQWPGNSSLSWGLPGSTIANMAVVAVDAAASFVARCEGAGGADLVVDCVGYYR